MFWAAERKVSVRPVPLGVLNRPWVAWGDVAGLIAFFTGISLVFSPSAAGPPFGVPGIGTVVDGLVAPKVIRTIGSKQVLITGGIPQTVFTAALLGLGDERSWVWPLLVATFVGGVGNMLVIVGFMVTATSGPADHEQGLASRARDHDPADRHHHGRADHERDRHRHDDRHRHLGRPRPSSADCGLRTAFAANAALVLVGALTSAALLSGARSDARSGAR